MDARAPLPEESAAVAALVLASDCGLLGALFGPTAETLVARLQSRPANPYSAAHTLVLAEPAGPLVGATVGSVVAATRREGMRTAAALAAWYGPSLLWRLPRLARAGAATASLAADDFYLCHIAVVVERRGEGCGRELLRAVERSARLLGARRLVLDVEEANTSARAFYEHMGYGELSVVTIDLGRQGCFTFRRLARTL